MDQVALDKFRCLLNEMKTQALDTHLMEVPAETLQGDAADITQQQLGNALHREVTARNAMNIRRIDAALKRIRCGAFGFCTECEEPIDPQRLESRPITTLCVSCKEDEEILQSGFAGKRRRSA